MTLNIIGVFINIATLLVFLLSVFCLIMANALIRCVLKRIFVQTSSMRLFRMSSKMLEGLQSRFKCLGCGKCCKHGGDMFVTADEVTAILEFIGATGPCSALSFFDPVPFRPGYFRVQHSFPCQFWVESDRTCRIYEVRPASCRSYPFMALARGETTLAGVTICEGASRQVTEEFFNDKEG